VIKLISQSGLRVLYATGHFTVLMHIVTVNALNVNLNAPNKLSGPHFWRVVTSCSDIINGAPCDSPCRQPQAPSLPSMPLKENSSAMFGLRELDLPIHICLF
jgi:hypothetical protein